MKPLPINLQLLEEHAAAAEQLANMMPADRLRLAEWALKEARRKAASGQHDAIAHFTVEGGRVIGYLNIYDDDGEGIPMRCVPHPAWKKSLPRDGEEWTVVGAGGTADGLIMALPVFNSRWN